ncbi:MAG: HTH-type transcriptional regulator CysB, partial [Burkholderiales bacterium]|nr:HTH-type transcriptional regulator CysB [Burkholderiales bacterium]
MGMGVGIVASMAFDPNDHKNLTPIKVNGLFPRSTTWIGYRSNMVIRCYMMEFLRLFAPHIDAETMDKITCVSEQHEL